MSGFLNPIVSAGSSGEGAATEDYILIRDEKSEGTPGGGFTSGSWQTRDLNTEVFDTGNNSSLSSNQFTLSAGTYRIRASAPAREVDAHRVKLKNITDNTDVLFSSNGLAGAQVNNYAVVVGRFTIASSKTFEIQHKCATTHAVNGFGGGASVVAGGNEVFTTVELWKEN